MLKMKCLNSVNGNNLKLQNAYVTNIFNSVHKMFLRNKVYRPILVDLQRY